MPVRVIVRSSGLAQADPPLALVFDAPRIVIGRGDGCEVRLPDPSVSSRHATLRQHGGTYLLVDEGSINGTYVGGVKLGAQSPRVLGDGELVRVGRVWLEIRFDAAAQPSPPQETKELALALVKRALASLGEDAEARLVVTEGPDQGKTLSLPAAGSTYILGRGHGVDLLLDEPDASRRHLSIVRKGDQLAVRDLGSKNGTFLGETRLVIGQDATWKPGQSLRLGADLIVYENAAADALAELDRTADDRMKEGEAVTPPAAEANTDVPPPSGSHEAALGNAGPLAAPPKSSAMTRAPANKGSGWGASDLVIVLLAATVFALSAGGLWMLFRG